MLLNHFSTSALGKSAFSPHTRIDLVLQSWPVRVIGGTLITVLVTWAVTVFLQRRRIAWRVYLDTPINLAPERALRQMGPRILWKILHDDGKEQKEVTDPSLVIMRFRNAGVAIGEDDFTEPISFRFKARTIQDARILLQAIDEDEGEDEDEDDGAVTQERAGQAALPETLKDKILPVQNMVQARDKSLITLGKFDLRHGERFRLFVVLSGTGVQVRRARGRLKNGRIAREAPRRGPATRSILFGGPAMLLLAGLFAGAVVTAASPGHSAGGASLSSACASGHLLLEGSTAFAPTAQQIGGDYHDMCPDASVSIDSNAAVTGSANGVTALSSTGHTNSGAAGTLLAMSDGPAPPGYPALIGSPVGLIIFTLVVNSQTDVFKLTTAQLRQIFSGTITNWRQLDGPNLPISIVSRYPGSGSRTAFDNKILGRPEPQVSSYDCIHKNAVSASPIIFCEEPTTSNLLQTVAAVPGAIGYAETGDVEGFAGGKIEPVELDGLSGNTGSIGTGPNAYHFWTIEFLYTYGTPARESLTNSFIAYAVDSSAAQNALRRYGYTPCGGSPRSITATLCGSSGNG